MPRHVGGTHFHFSYVCTRPDIYRKSECEHLNLRNPAFISARCRKSAQQCACQHEGYRILKIRQRCLHRVTVFRRSRICSNVDFLPKVVWCYAILYCTWVRATVLSTYSLISGFSRMHPCEMSGFVVRYCLAALSLGWHNPYVFEYLLHATCIADTTPMPAVGAGASRSRSVS